MREHTWDKRRDHAVHLLAQLSLIVVLAVLGALFVGSAATSDASEPSGRSSSAQTVRDQARPVGLLLGAVVIGSGLVVLVIGALKPPARSERHEYGELADH